MKILRYDLNETLKIVMEQKRELWIRQENMKFMICNLFTVILAGAAIALIGYRSTSGSVGGEKDFFGGYMLSPEIGGYVLVALLAFAAGLIAMVAINHYKKIQGLDGIEKGAKDEKVS